jgi:hypothetical protein
MNDDSSARPNPPPDQGGKFKFLLIALAPMPVGVFIVAAKPSQISNSQSALPLLGVLGFVCCIYGTIGMFGGYGGNPGPMPWIKGILLGIVLFFVEVFIVLFVGCVAFSQGF